MLSSSYGQADLEAGTPFTARSPVHVASVSKQFTAFSVALLAREGKLNLDSDVRSYLPWVPQFDEGVITVRHLLLHTSGLRDQWSLFTLGGQEMQSRLRQQQIINLVKRQKALNFKPGAEYSYSNTGYTLLAEIVKAVSGQTLRQFTAERIFQPLGMTQTFFFDDVTEVIPGRANSYARKEGSKVWQRELLNYDNVGATSLFTSAEDLARWAGNFRSPRVGDKALIEQVTAPGKLADGSALDYAFGLSRNQRLGHDTIEHSGSDAGFRSLFVYFPAHDFAVILLANTPLPLSEKVNAIAGLYLPQTVSGNGADAALSPAVEDEARLKALTGLYLAPNDPAIDLQLDDGELGYTIRRGQFSRTVRLTLREDDTLDDGRREWQHFKVVRDAQAGAAALEAYGRDGRLRTRYAKVTTPSALSQDQMRAYTGGYRSPELDVTYGVQLDDDGLLIDSIWSVRPVRLRTVAVDRFEADDWHIGTVVFQRDARGDIKGLLLHAGRIRNVEFDRVSAP